LGGKPCEVKKIMNAEATVLRKLWKTYDVEIVVNVQGDEPLIDKESLEKLLDVLGMILKERLISPRLKPLCMIVRDQ
jgi:CMP-2-keto-3-deoxyoctulosonic acid synthetase